MEVVDSSQTLAPTKPTTRCDVPKVLYNRCVCNAAEHDLQVSGHHKSLSYKKKILTVAKLFFGKVRTLIKFSPALSSCSSWQQVLK
jgi:hypothetical protein